MGARAGWMRGDSGLDRATVDWTRRRSAQATLRYAVGAHGGGEEELTHYAFASESVV